MVPALSHLRILRLLSPSRLVVLMKATCEAGRRQVEARCYGSEFPDMLSHAVSRCSVLLMAQRLQQKHASTGSRRQMRTAIMLSHLVGQAGVQAHQVCGEQLVVQHPDHLADLHLPPRDIGEAACRFEERLSGFVGG